MKKILLFFLLVFSVLSFSEEEDLYNAATRKEPINIAYKKGNTYKIYTKPLFQTIITFGDEIVEYSETGDNISFNTIEDKHSIRLKCVDEDLSTDLVVKTDKDFYYFKVKSTYNNYNPMINFLYPQKEITKKRNIEKVSEPLFLLSLDDLNTKYTISKKYSWTPTQIMDNGEKTLLFMPSNLQEVPAFLVRTEDSDEAVVTFRIKETPGGTKIYIVDRIFKEGVLILGNKKVIIKNKNFKY